MKTKQQVIGLVGIWLGGALCGFAASYTTVELKARKNYDLKLDSVKRAYEEAIHLAQQKTLIPETLTEAAEELTSRLEQDTPLPVTFAEPVVEPEPSDLPTKNPYHTAVEAISTPLQVFVQGEQNQFGISYINDEDYLDDGDGRFKGRIDIIMRTPEEPLFVMEGEPIDDWEKRLGTSILIDFFTLVPPGAEPVLYVRNHRTDEDYEVVQVLP